MERVQIKGQMLRWARDRSGLALEDFTKKFPHFEAWERGTRLPTLKQLKKFADGTYTPLGYLFLEAPPDEPLPIDDLRFGRKGLSNQASPHLLDTIYRCQQRQEWFHAHAAKTGNDPVLLATLNPDTNAIRSTASQVREHLGFGVSDRQRLSKWSEALSLFRQKVEDAGVLITINGVVGNNTQRKLDPEEFRGFALVDDLAPLIFVNGADTKSAQMFTVAHELAHLLIGKEGLSDAEPGLESQISEETWCNSFAGEFLIPTEDFQGRFDPIRSIDSEMERLAADYKVSTLVVLRRIRDHGVISENDYWSKYDAEVTRLKEYTERKDTTGGGNFYLSQRYRVGDRFARAIITSTLEGETSYVEALHLLDFSSMETLFKYARRLGFDV